MASCQICLHSCAKLGLDRTKLHFLLAEWKKGFQLATSFGDKVSVCHHWMLQNVCGWWQMDDLPRDSTRIHLAIQVIQTRIARKMVSVAGQINPTLFCEAVCWDVHWCAAGYVFLGTDCVVGSTNSVNPGEEAVIWIFGKSWKCASLRTLVVKSQKGAVYFPEGPVNLIKMHLRTISHAFLVCGVHRQLFWWNMVAVGNFTPKQNLLLAIVLICDKLFIINRHVPMEGKRNLSNSAGKHSSTGVLFLRH